MPKDLTSLYVAKRDTYIELLKPLFLPDDPVSNDIINYFASLLRVFGEEEGGWDPYAESRATLEDLNGFFKINLPEDFFPNPEATHWRIGLLLYSHIAEMDAPYEVLTNLLRFRLGKDYSPNPYLEFLTPKEKKSIGKYGIVPSRKIKIIQNLSDDAGLPGVGTILTTSTTTTFATRWHIPTTYWPTTAFGVAAASPPKALSECRTINWTRFWRQQTHSSPRSSRSSCRRDISGAKKSKRQCLMIPTTRG